MPVHRHDDEGVAALAPNVTARIQDLLRHMRLRLGRHIGFVAAWAGGVVAAAASAAHVASGVRQVQRLRTPWRLPPLLRRIGGLLRGHGLQILPGMCQPRVRMDVLHTVFGHGLPGAVVGQDLQQLIAQLLAVGGVHRDSVVQSLHDVHGPSILSGHRGHSMRRRLDDGETEGFLQCRVHEDAVRVARVAVDVRDVRLCMCLGVRHVTVEVVLVDEVQNLVQHFLAAASKTLDVLSVAHDEHQICPLPEFGVFAEGLDKSGDVLLCIGTTHRQNRRPLPGVQEPVNLLPDGALLQLLPLADVKHVMRQVGPLTLQRLAQQPSASITARGAGIAANGRVVVAAGGGRRQASFHRLLLLLLRVRGRPALSRLPGHELRLAAVESLQVGVLRQVNLEVGKVKARRDDIHDGHGAPVVLPPGRRPQCLGITHVVPIVQTPLLVDLLLGGGEDHGGVVQAPLLALDAALDFVRALDVPLGHCACGEQVLQLVATQGVAGHNHVQARLRGRHGAGHHAGHLAGVRIVTVHRVQLAGLPGPLQAPKRVGAVLNRSICKLAGVRPQLFLPEVDVWVTARQPHNVGAAELVVGVTLQNALLRLPVVVCHLGVRDEASQELHTMDRRVQTQRPAQFHNILDLATSVSILAQLHLIATHQAVQTDQTDVQPLLAVREGVLGVVALGGQGHVGVHQSLHQPPRRRPGSVNPQAPPRVQVAAGMHILRVDGCHLAQQQTLAALDLEALAGAQA
mmetsp:Transcript_1862/g.5451  ORF Transcript_1862/g.5451 Transcript_1862/m.5451 type:complete len:740 (-) Transcript_1862:804-3023(-)